MLNQTKGVSDSRLVNLKDLSERVEQLEISNSVTTNHTELLLEVIKIITEIPAGKQIFNRAINRQHLNRLRYTVLPRRQKDLANFFDGENSEMPVPIKDKFVADEMKLIRSVIREIQHRECYEEKSATTVRTILTQLFTKIKKAKFIGRTKQIPHIKNSLKGGRIHA